MRSAVKSNREVGRAVGGKGFQMESHRRSNKDDISVYINIYVVFMLRQNGLASTSLQLSICFLHFFRRRRILFWLLLKRYLEKLLKSEVWRKSRLKNNRIESTYREDGRIFLFLMSRVSTVKNERLSISGNE